jgi:hypothetical protein
MCEFAVHLIVKSGAKRCTKCFYGGPLLPFIEKFEEYLKTKEEHVFEEERFAVMDML